MPHIKILSSANWQKNLSNILISKIKKCIKDKNKCAVMLTGGESARSLYKEWSKHPQFSQLKNVEYFLGDERCVAPDSVDSNYQLAMHALFSQGVPNDCSFYRMEAESKDLQVAADKYAEYIPSNIDILLLSVGEDGHIASIFPYGNALKEGCKLVMPITSNKPPYKRMTITRKVIERSKEIFILCIGPKKRKVLNRLIEQPENFYEVPARLVMHGVWITDGSQIRF